MVTEDDVLRKKFEALGLKILVESYLVGTMCVPNGTFSPVMDGHTQKESTRDVITPFLRQLNTILLRGKVGRECRGDCCNFLS